MDLPRMNAVITRVVVAVLAVRWPAFALAQQSHAIETANETVWTGRYGNCDHGFFVLLPPGVVGHGTSPPAPNHGFMVNLESPASDRAVFDQHHRVVWVNEDYVFESGQDAYSVITRTGRDPHAQAHSVAIASHRRSTHLGDLPAVSLRTTYVENGARYISYVVAALSRDKGIEYTITLDTPLADAPKDEAAFRQIVAGFHTSTIDNSGNECSNE